jgi:hypothetical protein
MSEATPPLKRPEELPPIRSQADLHQLWRALMGELGFGSPQLWMVMLDADGRSTSVIQKITEIPYVPDPEMLGNLMTVCGGLLEEVIPGGSVAFLRARPGPAGITASDRAWATGLATAARERGVACHPMHVASDQEIRAFAPDDESASA